MRQGEHVAVYQIKIAAKFRRDTVDIFQLTDIVCGHPTVLPCGGVALHAGLVISTEQTFHIESEEVLPLLIIGKERSLQSLFPPAHPGIQGVFHKFQRLLFNIGKARLLQVTHHMGWHTEDSSDFIYLELSGLQELRFVGADGDGGVLHPLLHNCHTVGIAAPSESGIPAIPYLCRVFQDVRMLQHTAGRSAIGVELTAIFLGCDCKADGVLCHGKGAVTHKAVKAKARNMEDFTGV